MSGLVVSLFAGPGGTDEGLRLAGYRGRSIGLDNSADACRTAVAAGHERVRVDLTTYPPDGFVGHVDGIISTSPCPAWSVANVTRSGFDDPRGELIRVGLRWVLALRPRWTAWEITPRALPVFHQQAAVLRRAGYATWAGLLRAEDFGTPSNRSRAVLVARLDGPVAPPLATHPEPRSMADALGWDGATLVSNYGTNGDPKRRGRRTMDRPAFTITGKCGRNRWEWPDGTSRNVTTTEAGVLQGFRPDYPWQGGSISRQQQIGDTVPPPLAAAVLAPLLLPELTQGGAVGLPQHSGHLLHGPRVRAVTHPVGPVGDLEALHAVEVDHLDTPRAADQDRHEARVPRGDLQ